MLGLDPSVDAPKKSYFFLEVLVMNDDENLDLTQSLPFRTFDVCHQEAISKAKKIADSHGSASVTETDGNDPRLPRYCVISDSGEVIIAQIDMIHVDYSKETIH